MFAFPDAPTDRRGFVGATIAAGFTALAARHLTAPTQGPSADVWLAGLKAKHRQLFDMPEPDGGTGLRHIRNYLDAWRDAYGIAEREVNVVVTLYGRTTPLGLQDAMWQTYRLGSALSLTDPKTGAPLVRNWFAHPQEGDPVADGLPGVAMEALQRRGVLFLLCNNALLRWAGRLEHDGLGAAATIHADFVAHPLPGVVVVPDVLVAMTKAQERGFGYAKF